MRDLNMGRMTDAHMEMLMRDLNMERMTDAQLEAQLSQQFCDWYCDYVRHMSNKKFTKSQICLSFLFLN
jgi:hypothetical protein